MLIYSFQLFVYVSAPRENEHVGILYHDRSKEGLVSLGGLQVFIPLVLSRVKASLTCKRFIDETRTIKFSIFRGPRDQR